jgi:hypothetical protein
MVLYGEPGVGKSVFASKAPNPFFITTDGNYEFLEDFGAKPEDHIQVNSWAEAKKAFAKDFSNYDTIVVDLTEDLFKWCEYEYCRLNGYEHVSDPGFAKGYDITRNDFFINLCKILNQEKNVILIMHGVTSSVKDRRGIEHTKYYPTNRIPDKVMDMIEGRVRYFLRAYMKAEEDANGKLTKKRYLSLVPKENEYGILRGIDENTIPSDIPLDFNTFASTIGLEIPNNKVSKKVEKKIEQVKIADVKPEVIEEVKPIVEEKKVEQTVETEAETKAEQAIETKAEIKEEPKAEVKVEVKEEVKEEDKPLDKKVEMLAAIKAKMLAMQNKNK